MNKREAFNLYLPKWPQCYIWGKKITLEQADEIIRRTDYFFNACGCGGNNHEFNESVEKICKIPRFENFTGNEGAVAWDTYDEAVGEYYKKWGYVKLRYLYNDWVSSSYVGGPNGWCNPTGDIFFSRNIGKWPEVKEVYEDLKQIAEAFPFLDIYCTLMSGEYSEENTRSVISMHISDGKVRFIDTIPHEKIPIAGLEPPVTTGGLRSYLAGRISSENYYSLSHIQDWADKVYEDR